MRTLNQLVQFCFEQGITHFNANDEGCRQLIVKAPAVFSEEDSEDDDGSLFFADVLAFHTLKNANKSNVTEEAANKAMKKMAYKPVLANFATIDGVEDFTSHDMELDENGNIIYIEKQVGAFTADEPELVDDPDGTERKFVKARVAIPKDYTHAYDIIKRKGGTKVSVELGINQMSYDSKTDTLNFEDIEVLGLTLLGTDPDTGEEIKEGMKGAKLLTDFCDNDYANKTANIALSKQNNKLIYELKQLLNKYSEGKEENTKVDNEDINKTTPIATNGEGATNPVPTSTNGEEGTTTTPIQQSEDTEGGNAIPAEPVPNFSATVNVGEKSYTFSTSLNDTLSALWNLVNDTYGETDNDYYTVDAYPDDKQVIFVSWYSNAAYRQSYEETDGTFRLVGDRVAVHKIYVTDDEEKKLNDMKSNYSSIVDKLQKYEDEPKKLEILNSESYSDIANLAEFAELKQEKNHFDLSVEDVTNKADAILLKAAKSHTFSALPSEGEDNGKVGRKHFTPAKDNANPTTRGRYGNLFAEKQNKDDNN